MCDGVLHLHRRQGDKYECLKNELDDFKLELGRRDVDLDQAHDEIACLTEELMKAKKNKGAKKPVKKVK